jgi:hypothetical protein
MLYQPFLRRQVRRSILPPFAAQVWPGPPRAPAWSSSGRECPRRTFEIRPRRAHTDQFRQSGLTSTWTDSRLGLVLAEINPERCARSDKRDLWCSRRVLDICQETNVRRQNEPRFMSGKSTNAVLKAEQAWARLDLIKRSFTLSWTT